MARPAIEKEKFFSAIENMAKAGEKIEDITVAKLQAVVGGRWNRVEEILSEYKSAHAKNEDEEQEPMPEWFKEHVAQQHASTEGSWFRISSEMRKTTQVAAQAFEKERDRLNQKYSLATERINALEDENENQAEAIQEINGKFEDLKGHHDELRGQLVAKEAEQKEVSARYKDLEKEKSGLAADLKVAMKDIEQHQKTEYAKEQKIKELETMIAKLKSDNKDLDHRVTIAETREKDLQGNLSENKLQLAKEQAERAKVSQELKEVTAEASKAQGEAVKAAQTAQARIATLEKEAAVNVGKMEQLEKHQAGQAGRIKDMESTVMSLKNDKKTLEVSLAATKQELAKAQGEAVKAEKTTQAKISDLEKQVAVSNEKAAGQAEQIKNLMLQINDLKKKN